MEAAGQAQAHAIPVEAMRQAHGAPALISRPESSQAQDEAFDSAFGPGPSLRPTLRPKIGDVPANMKETATIAEGVPAAAGALSLATPAIAANPLRTASALVGGTVGGGAGRLIGETAGLSPENTQSLEDVGTLGGGVVGGTAPENNSWLARLGRNEETGEVRGPASLFGTDVRPVADAILPERRVSPPLTDILAERDTMYNTKGQAAIDRGKYYDAQQADRAQSIREAETSRQKELADQERLRTMDAQGRVTRGKQQDALDDAHASQMEDVQSSRQQELADQEQLRNIDATSRNSRIGEAPPKERKIGSSVTFSVDRPEVQGFVPKVGSSGSVVSSSTGDSVPQIGARPEAEPSRIADPNSPAPPVNKTLVSYNRGDLVKLVQDSSTPYPDRLAYIRELRRNPGNVPMETIQNLSRYMVEPGAISRIYGGPTQ